MKKVLINGFFRSGTSAVWDNIKKSNPGTGVFYEPCHPELIKFVMSDEELNSLHGIELWQEYRIFGQKLLSKHPYIGCSAYGKRVESYVELFEEYSRNNNKNLVLQSNRWHFELGNFLEQGYGVVHVVRSPKDVLLSMKTAYTSRESSRFAQFLKRILINYNVSGFWEFGSLMDYLTAIHSCESLRNGAKRNAFSLGLEEQFILIWTLVNYYAIRMLEKNEKGSVVSYEKLGDDDFAVDFFGKYDLAWTRSYFRKTNVDCNQYDYYRKIANELDILKEYEAVIDVLV